MSFPGPTAETRITTLFVAFVFLGFSPGLRAEDRCTACHEALSDRLSKPVSRWRTSSHAQAGVGCAECHGGDPQALRGGPEHARFPGYPSPPEIGAFCGKCHAEALALYRDSGHAKVRGDKPAVTCADCHGSHDVGDPPEMFSLAEYCGACHGLEYLLPLPSDLIRLVDSGDRLSRSLRHRSERSMPSNLFSELRALRREAGRPAHAGSLEVPRETVAAWIRRLDEISSELARRD